MIRRNLDYKFLNPAKNMPPLYHKLPGKEFDIEESEVAKYLVDIPEVRQKIFEMAKRCGAIKYDPETGVWVGADWNKQN